MRKVLLVILAAVGGGFMLLLWVLSCAGWMADMRLQSAGISQEVTLQGPSELTARLADGGLLPGENAISSKKYAENPGNPQANWRKFQL